MIFEPRYVDAVWLCPCQDAYGMAAHLKKTDGERQSDRQIENYLCDQNGDRWQQITTDTGTVSWHYLGRKREATSV